MTLAPDLLKVHAVYSDKVARQRALLKRAVELLRDSEWAAGDDDFGARCPHCSMYQDQVHDAGMGHAKDCEYVAFMKEAENEGC